MIAIFGNDILDVDPKEISILARLKDKYSQEKTVENWRKIEEFEERIRKRHVVIAIAGYVH
jgi:hypothetical protein